MADYYSILKKTISGLANNTPEIRQAVYAKARTAIESQLRRMDPQPGEEAISAQLKLLEEAIVVIESEYVQTESDPVAAALSEMAEPPTVTHIPPDPQTPEPVSVSPTIAPQSAPEEASASNPTPVEPVSVGIPHAPIDTKRSREKSGGLRKTSILLLVLLMIGGAGYGIWINRQSFGPMLAALTGSSDNPSQPQQQTANEPEAEESPSEVRVAEDNSEKEPVRLGANGQDEVAEPAETQQSQPETSEAVETPLVLDQPTDTGSDSTPNVEPVVEGTQDESAGIQEDASPTAANALGEVAYLYEEGSAGAGATRSSATVNWSLPRLKLSDELSPEPVIVGKMEVPEKGLAVDLTLKRNVDAALSASHIIELSFVVPEGFSGGTIDNIARFVMKTTEEARGEPLVAVPVKVSDGLFLIALDNLDQAVQVNEQLLLKSSWVDIPISYSTGKRALLTLEKGGSGEQVFKEAFEDWANR